MTHQITGVLTTADAVVQAFAHASEDFDPEIFDAYLKEYPHHGERLKSYAQVWLMSRRASPDEIAETTVPADRMLRAQSRMLMAWEQSTAETGTGDVAATVAAFQQFSGGDGLKSFAQILLDSKNDDESPLAMEYLDIGLRNVPVRREKRVANKVGISLELLPQAMAGYRSLGQAQTFHSARDKPAIVPLRSWVEAVRDLPVSEARKKELLQDD